MDLLYVHPYAGQYHPSIVPTGLISIMNEINVQKLGKIFFEVKKKEILNTKILVMDLHWFYSLYHVKRLCSRYKKINPEIIIIIGGYTATIYDEIIIREFDCDYIIKGDAEKPFRLLVNAILKGERLSLIPNITSKKFNNTISYKLNSKEFSRLNYTNISWFPYLKRFAQKISRKSVFSSITTYPFIQAIKGCNQECKACYGSKTYQKMLCNRSWINKDAKKIIFEMKEHIKKGVKQINFISDIVTVLGKKSYTIFEQRYNIYLFYQFFSYYGDPEIFHLFAKNFKKVKIHLPTYRSINYKDVNIPFRELFDLLKKIEKEKNLEVTLILNHDCIYSKKELKKLVKQFNVHLRQNKDIIVKVPLKKNSKKEFNFFLQKSKKEYFSIFRRLDEITVRILLNNPKFYEYFESVYKRIRTIRCQNQI